MTFLLKGQIGNFTIQQLLMIQPVLFNLHSFANSADFRRDNVRKAIATLDKTSFDSASEETIIAGIYAANKMTGFSIDAESITQSDPEDVKVSAIDETSPQGNALVDGTRFSFQLPFTGEAVLFNTRPTTVAGEKPFGEIKNGFIFFQLEQPSADNVSATITDFQTNITRLSSYVDTLNADIDSFNTALQQLISDSVNARKARVDKKYSDAALFEVPIA